MRPSCRWATTVRLLSGADHAVSRLAARRAAAEPIWGPAAAAGRPSLQRIEGTYTTPEQLVLLEAGGQRPDVCPRGRGHARGAQLRQGHGAGLELLKTAVSLRLCARSTRCSCGTAWRARPAGRLPHRAESTRAHMPIGEARFVPPPVAEMQEALAWEAGLHLDRTHCRPGAPGRGPLPVRAIHPFRGNAAWAACSSRCCATGSGCGPDALHERLLDRHRGAYMDHLLAVAPAPRGPWLAFFWPASSSAGRASRSPTSCGVARRVSQEGPFGPIVWPAGNPDRHVVLCPQHHDRPAAKVLPAPPITRPSLKKLVDLGSSQAPAHPRPHLHSRETSASSRRN